jgi:hypothetical protein
MTTAPRSQQPATFHISIELRLPAQLTRFRKKRSSSDDQFCGCLLEMRAPPVVRRAR